MTASPQIEIPDSDSPGGTGLQTAGPEIVVNVEAEPLNGLMNAVNGIVDARPKGLGGDVSAVLLQGMMASFQSELKSAKLAANRAQAANEMLAKELSATKEANATLKSDLNGIKKQHAFSSLGMTLATILAGLAVDAYKSGAERFAMACGVIALILVIGGWVIPNFKWKDK